MKYSLLTKEQFEELHPEFIHFLASQSIDKKEWDALKKEKPQIAQQEMEVFSDLVWERVLNNATYLENPSPQQLFLFKMEASSIKLILVTLQNEEVDLTTTQGLQWLGQHIHSEKVAMYTSQKTYSNDRNLDIFSLIQQGAIITKGEVFEGIAKFIDIQ